MHEVEDAAETAIPFIVTPTAVKRGGTTKTCARGLKKNELK
jgi:hypothetical protein